MRMALIVNDNGELEDGNHTLVGGTGYALSDLIIALAPFLYEEDQPFILRARTNDPLGEVNRVAFYANGVEMVGNLDRFDDITNLIYTPYFRVPAFYLCPCLVW